MPGISIENSYFRRIGRTTISGDAKLFSRAIRARARARPRLIHSVINDVDLINFNGSLAQYCGNKYRYKVARSRYYADIRVICALLKVLIGSTL